MQQPDSSHAISAGQWTAGAALYSGRPDPTWHVSERTARTLRETWHTLPVADVRQASPPGLGYRGCWLRSPAGERWFAYDGVVVYQRSSARGDDLTARRDPGRRFERGVLGTAPAGVLPKLGVADNARDDDK